MSSVILEKSSVVNLLKNFLIFYGTQRFITMLHCSLSGARSIQYLPLHLFNVQIILTTPQHFSLPSCHFPSGFPTNHLYRFFFTTFMLQAPPISSSMSWSLHLAKSTSYEAPHFTVSFSLLSFQPTLDLLCLVLQKELTQSLNNPSH
jgi:hypothetical protein